MEHTDVCFAPVLSMPDAAAHPHNVERRTFVEYDGRLTLAVPGSGFDADRTLEALSRFARAVGAKPERFVAALRL